MAITENRFNSSGLVKKLFNIPKTSQQPTDVSRQIQTFLTIYQDRAKIDFLELPDLQKELSVVSLSEISRKYAEGKKATDLFLQEVVKLLQSQDLNAIKIREAETLRRELPVTQYAWAPVKRDEMLRILIQQKREKRKREGKDFDCKVIADHEWKDWLRLKLKSSPTANLRFQLLVRNEVHYTALDFEWKSGKLRCCILDSAQDPKYRQIVQALQEMGAAVRIIGDQNDDESQKMQTDLRSCGIFGLDLLAQTSKDDRFLDKIFTMGTSADRYIPWESLPPRLVQNSQNIDFFDRYLAKNPHLKGIIYKSGKTFEEFIQQKLNHKAKNETEINTGIFEKLSCYRKKVDAFLASATTELLAKIAFESPFECINAPESNQSKALQVGEARNHRFMLASALNCGAGALAMIAIQKIAFYFGHAYIQFIPLNAALAGTLGAIQNLGSHVLSHYRRDEKNNPHLFLSHCVVGSTLLAITTLAAKVNLIAYSMTIQTTILLIGSQFLIHRLTVG